MRYVNRALRSVAAAALLAQTACDLEPPEPAGPLPPEKRDYVGVWERRIGSPGDEAYQYVIARISADGWMAYKKLTISGSGHYCTSYNSASIQEMKPDAIRAESIFGIDLNFSVEQPPRVQGDQWTMTLDGDRLVRARPEPGANPGKLDCDDAGEDEDREKKKTVSVRKSA